MRTGIGRLAGLAAGLTLAAALMAAAQRIVVRDADEDGPPEPQKEPGVYVRESATATDKFEHAKRMERLKEWPKSADIYQEILKKYTEPVVLTREQPYKLYQGMTWAVRDRLSRWPQEGLTVYRTRFEPEAAALLAKAGRGDSAILQQVLNQYFVTESAKQAGIRLMDLGLESGDFAGVAWVGEMLLSKHPTLAQDRPGVLFRTTLGLHLSGNTVQATKRLEELKAQHADAMGTVAGREMKLADALAGALEQKPPVAGSGGADAWRTMGGDASRGLIPPGGGKAGTRIYAIELPSPGTGVSEPVRQQMLAGIEEARNAGLLTSVMPAVDRGELFFQDSQRVWAVHLESGVPLAGWQQSYPQQSGQYVLSGISRTAVAIGGNWQQQQQFAARQHSLTLTDDAVLAVMGQSELRSNFRGVADSGAGTRLVCLERGSGTQRWIVNPGNLPGNAGNAKGLNFSGSPLVVGENVYVIVRGGGATGVEDCNLFCFDLQKGDFRWSCHIASAQNGMAMGMPFVPQGDSLSHPAFYSGRIYVLTNLGAVAAVDAFTGEAIWVAQYPRDAARIERQRIPQWGIHNANVNAADRIKPWEFNPVVVRDGKVFALPIDGSHIMVYDAGTGDEVKRIPREIEYNGETRKLTVLLGVQNEVLMAAAPDSLYILDWPKADAVEGNDKRLVKGAIQYAGVGFFDNIAGRPFVTAKDMLLPLKSSLSIFDVGRKRISERLLGPWPDDQEPGNVVVTGTHVVIANSRNVSVYTDIQSVRQKYANLIQADPGNLDHRLVLSELLFNAREIEESRTAMDGAIQVMGGMNAMRPGPARDRVFSDALLFAQKLSADKANEPAIAAAVQFYDRAAAAAANPSQQVNYRLSRAKSIEALVDAKRPSADLTVAVRLYQEILNDPAMRIITLAGDDKTPSSDAARRAAEAISDLMKKKGESIYANYAKEAAEKLASLENAGRPDDLLALAENYPNATAVAPRAMMLAAEAYEKASQPRQATQVLRLLSWKYASSPQFTAISKESFQEALARNHLRYGNFGAALGRLQQIKGETALSRPMILPDGKPLTDDKGQPARSAANVSAALTKLMRQKDEPVLADAAIPLPPTREQRIARNVPRPFEPASGQAVIAGVQAIVSPPESAALTGRRNDRLMAWSGGKLLCLKPGEVQPAWSSEAMGEDADGIHWIGGNVLAWGDEVVALIDGERGGMIWKSEVKSLVPVQIVTAAGVNDAMGDENRNVAQPIIEDRLAQRRVMMQAVRPAPNVPVADAQPADGRERVLHVCVLSDRIILSTTTGRIYALDLSGGRLIWQTRLATNRAIQQTLASDEFTVVRMIDGPEAYLIVLDSFNGQQLMRMRFPLSRPRWPINCVLSGDGVLVWTTADSIAGKDLYEPGTAATWERTGRSFTGLTRPDQLAIWGQELLALYNGPNKMIDRRKLRTGESTGPEMDSKATDASVRLRLIGSRLYAVGNLSLIVYVLDEQTSSEFQPDTGVLTTLGDMTLFTGEYVVQPAQITGRDGEYLLRCFWRKLMLGSDGKRRESALGVHDWTITEPAKIKAFQAVNGGVYYLAGDDKLHWLKGSRK